MAIIVKDAKKRINGKDGDGEGLTVRCTHERRTIKDNGKKSSKSKSKNNVTCFHYLKKGHIRRECLERLGKENGKELEDEDASVVYKGYEDADVLLVADK